MWYRSFFLFMFIVILAQDSPAQQPAEVKAHSALIHSMAISADGKWLATASFDKTIKLWEIQGNNLKEIKTITSHTEPVYCVAFSADLKKLASASLDKTIRIYSLPDCKQIQEMKGHTDLVSNIAFSPDGKLIASGSGFQDKSVRLWNTTDGKELKNLGVHGSSVYTVNFSKDNKQLVSSGGDMVIKLWDVPSQKMLKEFKGHELGVTGVLFDKDPQKLISVSQDRTLRVWNIADGKEIQKSGPSTDDLFGIATDATQEKLATIGYSGNVSAWQINNPKAISIRQIKSPGYCIALSPDGKWIFTGHENGTIQLTAFPNLPPAPPPVKVEIPKKEIPKKEEIAKKDVSPKKDLPKIDPPKPTVNPEAQKVRDIVELNLVPKKYVFDENQFPEIAFNPIEKAKTVLGNFKLEFQYWNDKWETVTTPVKPGMYGVVVKVVPEKGTPYQEYITLYRVGQKLTPAKLGFDNLKAWSQLTGIDANQFRVQLELVRATIGMKTPDQFSDIRIAKLLAGMSLTDPKMMTTRKNLDAFAHERDWWVTLKRKLNGMDKRFPNLVTAPDLVIGVPAPVVRPGTLEQAGMLPDTKTKLDAILTEWAKDDDEAFAVCIVRNGTIVHHKAYGMRDGKPMTLQTKSWMASITKPMSASCMMMLVDRGLVDLDKPISEYLPSLANINVPKPLTVRHLYTHTAGLSVWPNQFYQDERPEIEDRVRMAYPFLEVGKTWAYNGQSYALAGKIIESVSGEAMPVFYWNHLFGPLKCENTDVAGTHGDAFSVPLDIAKFGQMLLNEGSYGNLRFFRPETFQKMLPHTLTDVLGPGATKTFGLGLDGSVEKFGHGAASAATFQIDRKEKLIVVMTRNKMGKNQGKYQGKFTDAIMASIRKK